MAEQWRVVNKRGQVVHEGDEDSARTYVVNNYPRVHVEPGSASTPEPDAVLAHPGGGHSYWNGSEWLNPDDDTNDDDEEEE